MPGYMAIGTLPPYEITVAAHPIVIEFDESWAHEAFVTRMRVGDQVVYPPPCASPQALAALCSKAYRELGGHEVFAVKLVGQDVTAELADFLFAAVYEGAGDCGAYGYWLVRVESARVRATPPVRGCFAGPRRSRDDGGVQEPTVRWRRPLSITVDTEAGAQGRPSWQLDEGTFTWTRTGQSR
ncbi:MAG: hypothetical protein ABSE49_26720 [Polyangiaceae bacterium]|jgi:hypothetical protein